MLFLQTEVSTKLVVDGLSQDEKLKTTEDKVTVKCTSGCSYPDANFEIKYVVSMTFLAHVGVGRESLCDGTVSGINYFL